MRWFFMGLLAVVACNEPGVGETPGGDVVDTPDTDVDGTGQDGSADAWGVSDLPNPDATSDAMLDTGGDDIGSDPADVADGPGDAGDGPDNDAGDSGDVADGSSDVGSGAAVSEPGCFFEVQDGMDLRRYDFGERGTSYDRIEASFTLRTGPWREEYFDRQVLTHIFFGLFRNAPSSRGRYILGAAAQFRPARLPGTRQAVFFSRVDLEPRPEGEGYTAYTSVREDHPWEPATTYRVHAVLDAVRQTQHLTLTPEGGEPLQMQADIAYFTRDLTSSGWWLELGATDTDHRDVNVVGWTFCDLEIITQ